MNDKELIRRALMGDKIAQMECTNRGIILPCPICGGEIKIKQCDWDMFYPYCDGCKLTFNFLFDSEKDAIEIANTRPARRKVTESKEKLCPFKFNGKQGQEKCQGEMCAFWCEFAHECAVPLLAGMFADSTICQNVFKGE